MSKVNSVTSDMLPTVCDLAGMPLPNRPLDGISLVPLLEGKIDNREEPICFWMYDRTNLDKENPYISESLQTGTTPLVKLWGDSYIRTFQNYHHQEIVQEDYKGDRSILDDEFKLIVRGFEKGEVKELYNIASDPGETEDLAELYPEKVDAMGSKMKGWQTSVLTSLTERDYQ